MADFGFEIGRKRMEKTIWIGSLSGPNLKSKIQNPKWVGLFAIVAALTACGPRAQAQQPAKVAHIGFLDSSTASASAVRVEAFWQELRKLGWIEGKNITVEYRFAEQKSEG